jgi:hypothetical protein
MVYLGVEPRSVGIAFAEGLCDLGVRGQGSRAARGLLVAPTRLSFEGLPRLACWTSNHPGLPGDFSRPSVGTGAFRVAVLRGSPHQLILIRTLGQCSDVVGGKWNPRILVNLPVANVPR